MMRLTQVTHASLTMEEERRELATELVSDCTEEEGFDRKSSNSLLLLLFILLPKLYKGSS